MLSNYYLVLLWSLQSNSQEHESAVPAAFLFSLRAPLWAGLVPPRLNHSGPCVREVKRDFVLLRVLFGRGSKKLI